MASWENHDITKYGMCVFLSLCMLTSKPGGTRIGKPVPSKMQMPRPERKQEGCGDIVLQSHWGKIVSLRSINGGYIARLLREIVGRGEGEGRGGRE